MNDIHGDEHHSDEHLLAVLRSADPAAGLPPLHADALGDLLGSITRTPRTSTGAAGEGDDAGGDARVDHAPATTAATATAAAATAAAGASSPQVDDLSEARRRRQRRRWGGAAGLGLAAAAAGVIALTTGVPGITGTTAPTVTALQAAGPVTGGPATSCAVLEASSLSSFDTAFEGRVREIRPGEDGEVVVMEVERVYRGDVAQQVEVSTPGAGSLLDGTVSLVQGGDYLVAASDGQVAGCGASGVTSPELGALYEQAFGAGR
jgi:hypothetical protein